MKWSFKNPAKKSIPRPLWKRILLGAGALIAGVAGFYGAVLMTFYGNGRGDKLTRNEKAVVAEIFGDEINTSKVRKHLKEKGHITHVLRSKIAQVPPLTNHIDFFGKDRHTADYGAADLDHYGTFMHEMTHVWQNQHKWVSPKRIGIYTYQLDEETKFDDLGIEQQAAVIEDYARIFLHKSHGKAYNYNGPDANTPAYFARLAHVVEDRFPNARKHREKQGMLLTEGETRLLKSIFGQQFNTYSIRKHIDSTKVAKHHKDEAPAYVNFGDTVNIYFNAKQAQFVAQDYSTANKQAFGTFVHEATHIWQAHAKIKNDNIDRYGYVLRENSTFLKLNIERQASLVKDYAYLFLSGQDYTTDYDRSENANTREAYRMIADVVEAQFPEARKSRIAFEQQRGKSRLTENGLPETNSAADFTQLPKMNFFFKY